MYGDSLRASEIAKSGEYLKTNVLAAGNCRIQRYKRTAVCWHYHQQTDPPCSNMFWNSRAGPSGRRPEHVLGDRPEHVLGDHPKLLCQQCLEQLQVHQSMLWATVQNCFKYTKIQGRACSGLQSLFPKLLQVHKNMFWATILNCFKQVLGDHTKLLQAVSGQPYKTASSSFKLLQAGGVRACLKHA